MKNLKFSFGDDFNPEEIYTDFRGDDVEGHRKFLKEELGIDLECDLDDTNSIEKHLRKSIFELLSDGILLEKGDTICVSDDGSFEKDEKTLDLTLKVLSVTPELKLGKGKLIGMNIEFIIMKIEVIGG